MSHRRMNALNRFCRSLRYAGVVAVAMAVCVTSTNLVAEEIGKSKLAKILTGRNEMMRLRALAPLEHDVRAKIDALDDLAFALRSHVDDLASGRPLTASTVQLTHLIGTINRPAAKELLIELLDCEQIEIAMICADTLGRIKHIEAIDHIKTQVERPEWESHYGFRFNVVRSLAQMEHPDAYEFLNLIRRRVDGKLLNELNEVFENVTLDDFRGDQERFERWKLGDTIKTADGDESDDPDSDDGRSGLRFKSVSYSESAQRVKLQRTQYYGIDIEAKRMMFIIDRSGSMRAPVYRGTRLSRAKAELIRVIKSLPEDNEFAVMFYDVGVRVWRNELLPASEKNKKDAIKFISRLGCGGKTNTHGALAKSLSFDDDLEAVFLLSDGAPTYGQIVAPAAIINDIVLRNRLRHLTINTIGIGVAGNTRVFLKSLAEQCSGVFREPKM